MKEKTAREIAKALFHYFHHDLDRSVTDHLDEILPELDPGNRDRICGEMTRLVQKIANKEGQ
jgi:hypothetical protein